MVLIKTKIKNTKLKGTTLVEVLVASIITAISFGIGLMIYTNVLHSNRSKQKTEISLLFEQHKYQTILKEKYQSKIIHLENIEIQENITLYKNKNDLLHLNYKALNTKGEIILEKNYLKYIGK